MTTPPKEEETREAEKSHLLAYLKHTPKFEHRIEEFRNLTVGEILARVHDTDAHAYRICIERFWEQGTELEPDPDEQRYNALTRLRDWNAGKILNWTMPYLHAAGKETRQLANPEWRDIQHVAQYIATIEQAVLRWEQQSANLLPPSWENIGSTSSIVRCATGNMMIAQFEECHDYSYLTEDGAPCPGESQDTLAGINKIYVIRQDCSSEQIHEHMTAMRDNSGVVSLNLLGLEARIRHLIDIAHDIMGVGHAAITGVATHAMATVDGTTTAEAPAEGSLASAAQTMAFAGALAAAAAAINQILWAEEDCGYTETNQQPSAAGTI